LAGDASFLGVIPEVAEAVGDVGHDLDDCLTAVKLRLQDLRKHLVNVVWIATLDSDLEGFLVVLDLKQKGDLLHDLLFILNKVVTETLLARVMGQLCQLGEVNTELDLVQNVVVISDTSCKLATSNSLGLNVLLLASGPFDV